MSIKLKRVYETPNQEDGTRVLVDTLWPGGLTKAKAALDLWLKEIAFSTELRRWFDHDPKKWKSFRSPYLTELKSRRDELGLVKSKARGGTITTLRCS
jgi:uncharacterized protein YeaO (DUF488 family)